MPLSSLDTIGTYVTVIARDINYLFNKLKEYKDLLADELHKKGKVIILEPPSRCIIAVSYTHLTLPTN